MVHYTLHQQTNDIHTLKPHLDTYQALYNTLPETVTADAGYGSEENYQYLEQKGVTGYVKYSTFDKAEQTYKRRRRKSSSEDFNKESLHYNEQEDIYVCPMGQRIEKAELEFGLHALAHNLHKKAA